VDEAKFWSMIEAAWGGQPEEINSARAALVNENSEEGSNEEAAFLVCEVAEDMVVAVLREALKQISQEDIAAFDRILERKLYDIDREDIHEYTDGSDDGFLYCRGFIVAAGQAFYDAVNADPSKAVCDAECESITYISAMLYEELYGDFPSSDICRESFSNSAQWD
jgi:hypothetical protein